MLAKRIIPCLDVMNGRVVKGFKFFDHRDAGDPVELGAFYDREGADELVFYDITASHEKREIVAELARRVAEQVFIPYAVGGGVRTVDDFRELLKTGADKIHINTGAVEHPEVITEAAERFGSQCVVVSIDAKRREGGWEVYVNGGRTPTDIDAVGWAVDAARRGAGELTLNSIDADGTLAGYDLELTRAVATSVDIPVIASGGAGRPEHAYQAVVEARAEAALIASIGHYKTFTIRAIKDYLAERGVPVRPVPTTMSS
jgi:cyclase